MGRRTSGVGRRATVPDTRLAVDMARTTSTPTRRDNPVTTVLLVRHGKTPTTGQLLPGRAPGLHLAETGVEQAQRAAERVAELERVDAVYASPLERARETAAPIGKAARASRSRSSAACSSATSASGPAPS